jgi:hypothetical protein
VRDRDQQIKVRVGKISVLRLLCGDLQREPQLSECFGSRLRSLRVDLQFHGFGSSEALSHEFRWTPATPTRSAGFLGVFRMPADSGTLFGPGFLLLEGRRCWQEVVAAADCFRLSADEGDSVGQNSCGNRLISGFGAAQGAGSTSSHRGNRDMLCRNPSGGRKWRPETHRRGGKVLQTGGRSAICRGARWMLTWHKGPRCIGEFDPSLFVAVATGFL